MSFANMKVGTRLGLGFGIVILLLLIILVTAIINMAAMNQETQMIVSDRYVKVAILNKVALKTMDNAPQLRNMVLVDDPVKVEGYLTSILKDVPLGKLVMLRLCCPDPVIHQVDHRYLALFHFIKPIFDPNLNFILLRSCRQYLTILLCYI